jgi:hypothetical protein
MSLSVSGVSWPEGLEHKVEDRSNTGPVLLINLRRVDFGIADFCAISAVKLLLA